MERDRQASLGQIEEAVRRNKESARQKNLPPWFGEVLTYSRLWIESEMLQSPNTSLESLAFSNDLKLPLSRWGRDLLQNLSVANEQIFSEPQSRPAATKKNELLMNAGRQIRHQQDYETISQMGNVIEALQRSGWHLPSTQILASDVATLLLLAGDEDKFLVGVKGGPQWKRIKLPDTVEKRFEETYHLASHYILNLSLVGKKEARFIPDDPISAIKAAGEVNLPHPARSVEELLEDSYFHQRYIIPPDGAEVRFRKAGDLEKMMITVSGDHVMARVVTSKGDAMVVLNTSTADWSSPEKNVRDVPTQSRWASVLAEVYHDMVTAEEVPVDKFKRLRGKKIQQPGEIETVDSPEIIYIPRKVKTGIEPRIPYTDSSRPIKPRRVSGYVRKGNMTSAQRLRILDLEHQLGISILKFVPGGKTFVRPHVTPKGSEVDFSKLPIFIKRRVETQLADKLQPNKVSENGQVQS